MTDGGSMPQMDPAVMAALQAKVARLQKILGLLTYLQGLVGLFLLAAPIWLAWSGLKPSPTEVFPYMSLAPFFFALAYSANFAKKDLTFAKVVLRSTAIGELGFALIAVVAIPCLHLPVGFWGLAILAIILGGLPAYVIYQFNKSQS